MNTMNKTISLNSVAFNLLEMIPSVSISNMRVLQQYQMGKTSIEMGKNGNRFFVRYSTGRSEPRVFNFRTLKSAQDKLNDLLDKYW